MEREPWVCRGLSDCFYSSRDASLQGILWGRMGSNFLSTGPTIVPGEIGPEYSTTSSR